jgi:hypothetical protein
MSEDNGLVSGMLDAKMTSDGTTQQVSMTLLDSGANIQITWPLDMEEDQSDRLSSVVANLSGILDALYEGITEDPDGHFVAVNLP